MTTITQCSGYIDAIHDGRDQDRRPGLEED